MAYRDLKIASLVVVAAMAAAAVITLRHVPAGTQIPVHFDLSGTPDRYAGPGEALFWPIGLAAFVSLLMAALPSLEPHRDRLANSAGLYRIAWGGVLALMAFLEAMMIGLALGFHVPATAPLAVVGLMLAAIGNALPKSRPNFFVGIRTPWTLSDTDTWVATHRFGAWAMTAAGLLFVLAALVPTSAQARTVAIGFAIALMLLPLPYSYWYWRQHRAA